MYAIDLYTKSPSKPFYSKHFKDVSIRDYWVERMVAIYKCKSKAYKVTGL